MGERLDVGFFARSSDIVAKELLGNVLVRKFDNGEVLKARIVEGEAYFGEDDSASWARFGKRKDNIAMWATPGTILVKNVHKHFMLNFVTGKEGEAGAVLIRALQPLNFSARSNGPGLLTAALKIDKSFNGRNFFDGLYLEEPYQNEDFEIGSSGRIGVRKDLEKELRFYIKGNGFVSRKNGKQRNNRKDKTEERIFRVAFVRC